jgi:hypothetical protein
LVKTAILIETLALFARKIERAIRCPSMKAPYGAEGVPAVILGPVSAWARYVIEIAVRDGLTVLLTQDQILSAVCCRVLSYQPASNHPIGPSLAAYP